MRRAAVASLVPTRKTRALVRRMVVTAEQTSGAQAALLLDDVDPDQLHALVGVLLAAIRPRSEGHRGRLPDTLTDAEMKRGYALYRRGVRTPFTRAARRQYDRQHKRAARTASTKGHG